METEILEIIERFHKAIADSEYSYTDIEKKTGIPRATVQRWATGKTKGLPIEGIKKVCSAIGVDAAEILGWTKEKAPTEADAEINEYLDELKNRREMRMLFSVTKDATKEEIEQAVKIIMALRSKDE